MPRKGTTTVTRTKRDHNHSGGNHNEQNADEGEAYHNFDVPVDVSSVFVEIVTVALVVKDLHLVTMVQKLLCAPHNILSKSECIDCD